MTCTVVLHVLNSCVCVSQANKGLKLLLAQLLINKKYTSNAQSNNSYMSKLRAMLRATTHTRYRALFATLFTEDPANLNTACYKIFG